MMQHQKIEKNYHRFNFGEFFLDFFPWKFDLKKKKTENLLQNSSFSTFEVKILQMFTTKKN